jgi:hypothetical protein
MKRSSIALMLLLLVGVARADEPTPHVVTTGIYLNQLYSVDIKNSQFTADFYLWFRWKGDELKPLDTFELPSGRVTSRTGIVKKKIGDENYVCVRLIATFTKFWDLRRYPLDAHTLNIEIEDSDQDIHHMVYVLDKANTAFNPDLQVPGWTITKSGAEVTTATYHTNYGDTTLAADNQSAYSRLVYTVDVARPGYGRFLKVFFGLFISVLISWCGFFVRPKESSPRVSLGVGATFAAAAVTVAINNSLPDTNAVMLADKLVMLTLGTIVAAVAETITALWLFAHEHEAAQKRLDRICSVLFPAIYISILISIVM